MSAASVPSGKAPVLEVEGLTKHFPMKGGLFGRTAGALVGGIRVKKGEANVVLSLVNARTTVEEALVEGYFRKKDPGWAAGGGLFGGGGGAAGGFGGYENTAIGQIIVLAYLNAYTDLVTQLGGLPTDAAAAAPVLASRHPSSGHQSRMHSSESLEQPNSKEHR